MFFPSITLCNLNLVEASFFKTHKIPELGTSRQNIVNEFIRGYAKNLDEDIEHEKMVKYFQNLTAGELGYQWMMTSKPVELKVRITELHYVG